MREGLSGLGDRANEQYLVIAVGGLFDVWRNKLARLGAALRNDNASRGSSSINTLYSVGGHESNKEDCYCCRDCAIE